MPSGKQNAQRNELKPEELRALWEQGAWSVLLPILKVAALHSAKRVLHRDTDRAEDVAAETIVRCWQAEVVPTHPIAFARKIARNLAIDQIRWSATRFEVSGNAGEYLVQQHESDEIDLLSKNIDSEQRRAILAALNDMPADARQILIAQVYGDRSVKTLANEFQCSEGAVKMRLVRARELLKRLYAARAVQFQNGQWQRRRNDRMSVTEDTLELVCNTEPVTGSDSTVMESRIKTQLDAFEETEPGEVLRAG